MLTKQNLEDGDDEALEETRAQRMRRLTPPGPRTSEETHDHAQLLAVTSKAAWAKRLTQMRWSLDQGKQLSDEELEYLINRPAIDLLESDDQKDVHKAMDIFQAQRIKRLAVKEAQLQANARRSNRDPTDGLDLPT